MSPYHAAGRLAGRHPFELFTLFLMVLSSLPTVLGLSPLPGSLAVELPHWLGFVWACTLLVGSLTAVTGMFLPSRRTGLLCEQFGLATTGVAAIIYAGAIWAFGFGGPILIAIVSGFGLSCLARWWQIQRIINDVTTWEKLHRRIDQEGK